MSNVNPSPSKTDCQFQDHIVKCLNCNKEFNSLFLFNEHLKPENKAWLPK